MKIKYQIIGSLLACQALLLGQLPLETPANRDAVRAALLLNNVDNTSDANKPVSTAAQTALNLKANLASPTLTGIPAVPTAAANTNTTQIASTAFVMAGLTLKVDSSLLSTTGGNSKVPQSSSVGNWQTGSYTNAGDLMGNGGNILMPDNRGIRFMRADGSGGNSFITHNQAHDGWGGELYIVSNWRIAVAQYGVLQMGVNDGLRYPRETVFVSGSASNGDPTVNRMPSGTITMETNTWNGSGSATNNISLQAHPLDGTGNNSILRFYDKATVFGSQGGGAGYQDGIGYVEGNVISEVYKDGIWSVGTAPPFVSAASGTITITASKYKNFQTAKTTLTGNSTLAIMGLKDGMRGEILVTQGPSGGPFSLTHSGGSALDLSTAANATDLVNWKFDGLYVTYAVEKNIQRQIPTLDTDASTFVTNASISDNSQKVAVNLLVESLKEKSLWSKFQVIYPFVGGTSTAHSKNLKSNTFNITWANDNAARHNANGVNGDVASSFSGDTGFMQSANGHLNAGFFYAYCKTTTPTADGYLFGANDSTVGFCVTGIYRNSGTLLYASFNQNPYGGFVTVTDFRQHIMLQKRTATTVEFGLPLTLFPSAASTSVEAVDMPISILGLKNFGSVSQHSNANLAFFAIASSYFNKEERANFMKIVDDFQTALGRKNP